MRHYFTPISMDITKDTKINKCWDFPGGPVVKTPCFHCRGHRFDPWLGKIPMPHGVTGKKKKKKEKERNYKCTSVGEDVEKWKPHILLVEM